MLRTHAHTHLYTRTRTCKWLELYALSLCSILCAGGRRSPAVACWASDHWVASSNPLGGKFRHLFRLIILGVCLAQFSLTNVHKRGLKHHHFISQAHQCLHGQSSVTRKIESDLPDVNGKFSELKKPYHASDNDTFKKILNKNIYIYIL